MANIVLLGPPGAGKGTQSEKIVKKYRLTPVTPGNLMREHIKQGSTLGKLLASYIDEGQLAPHEIVMQLVEEQLAAHSNTPGFLFDGFPRAIAQATSLDELLLDYGYRLDGVLFLQVPDEEVKRRIKSRAKITERSDDQDESKVMTRLGIYVQETLPVIADYEKQRKLFGLNGMGPEETVFENIVKVLDSLQLNQ